MPQSPPAPPGAALAERLRERRPELEAAVLTRVFSVPGGIDRLDTEYAEGLRAAVAAAIDYGFAGIERGGRLDLPVPPALLIQARIAARHGVSLDTVLRRYFAGYTLLSDFLIEEVADGELLDGQGLKLLLRSQARLFDRLLVAASEEHGRELQRRTGSSNAKRRVEVIQRLLDGEPLDASELGYDLEAHHVAVVASGPGITGRLRALARTFDQRLLAVRPGEGLVWAWLGSERALDPGRLLAHLSASLPTSGAAAIGERAAGQAGWRLTHRQARAALLVAQRREPACARYADVALLASILQDEVAATSLRSLYLEPLGDARGGGQALRETLRAYFAADRNVTSAAASLGVTRQAVARRLCSVEERLGRRLATCAVELEAALRLEEAGPA